MGGVRAQELCESRGGRPGLPSLINLMVSVDVKQHSTKVGGGGWWVGGTNEWFFSELRPEENDSHRQHNSVKEVGTSPLPSNLCTSLISVSAAVQSRVTKTMSVE